MEGIDVVNDVGVATILIGASNQLNGNETPVMQDFGTGASRIVADMTAELARRIKNNPALQTDATLRPVFSALASLSDEDLQDPRKVADALKGVRLSASAGALSAAGVEQQPVPPNPFRLDPA